MTTNKPLFRFNARAVESDPTGYYMTRWDRAQSVSVLAETRDEAYQKIFKMMGDPRSGRTWTAVIDSADEMSSHDNQ